MAARAYGRELGESVGAETAPVVRTRVLQQAEFAATRIQWSKRLVGSEARIPRENAYLVCLQRRSIPTNPYWVDGCLTPMSPVRRGQSTLLDLNQQHESFLTAALDCVAIHVPYAAIDRIAEEHDAPHSPSFRSTPGVPVDDNIIWGLGESLLPALERPAQASRLFLDHLAVAFLTHFTATYGGKKFSLRPKRGGLAPWQERRAKDLLMANLSSDIGLEALARECNLSRSHFARAFKVSTGLPPFRWLFLKRIECARELIAFSDLSLGEIAARCGFADQSHLTRTFVKEMGVTPSQWRRIRRF